MARFYKYNDPNNPNNQTLYNDQNQVVDFNAYKAQGGMGVVGDKQFADVQYADLQNSNLPAPALTPVASPVIPTPVVPLTGVRRSHRQEV